MVAEAIADCVWDLARELSREEAPFEQRGTTRNRDKGHCPTTAKHEHVYLRVWENAETGNPSPEYRGRGSCSKSKHAVLKNQDRNVMFPFRQSPSLVSRVH